MKFNDLFILLAFVLSFFWGHLLQARPVSYVGGWTSLLMTDSEQASLLVHYTPAVKYSVGYRLDYGKEDKYTLHALQVNHLLKRWNQKNSQANLYLKQGLGLLYDKENKYNRKLSPALFLTLAADWEDRMFFVSYKNRYVRARNIDDFNTQALRLGVAPYVAGYGALHTWFMVQVEHRAERKNNNKSTVTPLFRFFKGVHLVELGFSKGKTLFNWIIRY